MSELQAAVRGTVRTDGRGQDPYLIHTVNGKEYRTKISTLRGDYRGPDGATANRLRQWEKHDFKPRADDIFQERLYCIQWMRPREDVAKATNTSSVRSRRQTWRGSASSKSSWREHLAEWQANGLGSRHAHRAGEKTDEPIRTRGWTYWHHLWPPRQLLTLGLA